MNNYLCGIIIDSQDIDTAVDYVSYTTNFSMEYMEANYVACVPEGSVSPNFFSGAIFTCITLFFIAGWYAGRKALSEEVSRRIDKAMGYEEI